MVNESTNECNIIEGEDVVLATVPIISNLKDLFGGIMKLKVQYDKSIMKASKLTINDKSKHYHEICNKRGEKKLIENGIYGSLVICKCHDSYTGTNCQIPTTVVDTYQKSLDKLIGQLNIRVYGNDQTGRRKLLDSFLLATEFEVNLPLIKKMHSFIRNVAQHDKLIENRKKLYNIFDKMLLNLIKLVHEEKYHKSDGIIVEQGTSTHLNAVYDEINSLIETLVSALEDLKYSHSFLEFDMKHYLTIDTFSYTLAEYRYRDYMPDRGFFISNPTVEGFITPSYTMNTIFIEFNKGHLGSSEDYANSQYYLQILDLSILLLENKLESAGIKPLSDAIYLRNVDTQNMHSSIDNEKTDVKSIIIKFALHSLPIDDEPMDGISCTAYNFELDKKFEGTIESFIDPYDETKGNMNDNNAYASCRFDDISNFKSIYFMAALKDSDE